jgi:predicted dehydrogenase
MAKTIRIGVIGLGMGSAHATAFLNLPDCTVAAISDLNKDRLTATGDKLGVAARFTDAEAMMDQVPLDAVVVATPNKFHAPLTLAAFKRGLHVLCEKPMAMNVAEAKAMKAAAIKARRRLMINFSYRFSPMSIALKQQVEAGVVGPIYFGRTVWHRQRGMPGFGGWFGNKELAGGGPLIDLGVHRIDLALWLMGRPEPVSVSGSAYNVIAKRIATEQKKLFTVEDLACGIVKFANGATLIVEASWALNVQEPEHMITSLYGEKGAITQKNVGGGYQFQAELVTEEHGCLFTKVLAQNTRKTPSAQEEFLAAIREKREPSASADDGIRVQKILDGLYASALKGREILFKK